jgi:hypothetical protein
MWQEEVTVSKFAEEYYESSTSEIEEDIQVLKQENTEPRRRMEAAEAIQRELMEMLRLTLQRRYSFYL